MAAHLDTIAVNAAGAQEFDLFRTLAYPIAAMSQNVAPATVSLMVNGTSQSYQAIAVEVVGTSTGSSSPIVQTDSFMVVVVWTGENVSDLVYSQVLQPDTLVDWANVTGSVPNFDLDSIGSSPVFNASIVSAPNGCGSYSLPDLNEAVLSLLKGSSCKSGTATVAFSYFVTPNPPSNPNSTYLLASQSIPAVRLVLPATTGGQERLRALRAHLGTGSTSFRMTR
jgi:hypothetical protein